MKRKPPYAWENGRRWERLSAILECVGRAGAATTLSGGRERDLKWKISARAKAVSRCACHRSPRHAGANFNNSHRAGCAGTPGGRGGFFLDKIFGGRKFQIVKNNESPRFGGPQGVGQEIIKIIEANKLARWQGFNPATREYEVKTPDGVIKIHESKTTKKFTAQEELDFLRSEEKSN